MNRPQSRLRFDALEPRAVPASSVQPFDLPAGGAPLPAGWSRPAGDTSFRVEPHPTGGALVTRAASNQSGSAWIDQDYQADTAAAVTVRLDSLQPVRVFARGRGLDTATPTYYAASVTRGLELTLERVVDGRVTTLATLKSAGYVSQTDVRVSLRPVGTTLAVSVRRLSDGRFLAANGQFVAGETAALTVADGAIAGSGKVGVARPARYAGAVVLDDFEVIPPAGTGVTFDGPGLPPGWASRADPGASVGTAGGRLATTAASGGPSSRAWLDAELAADQRATASVYLDSLAPAQVLVRGRDLGTAAPDYYAVTVTRGAVVQLVRVVDGVTTVLGEVTSKGYLSGVWVRVTAAAQGDRVVGVVQRLDTLQYLAADGTWRATPTAALAATDAAIAGPGRVGLARPARYAGTVLFDDFDSGPATNPAPRLTVTSSDGGTPATGVVRVEASADDADGIDRLELLVDGQPFAAARAASGAWDLDTAALTAGTHTLTVLAYDALGAVTRSDRTLTVARPQHAAGPPALPRHYDHIRIAMLAYEGTPVDDATLALLRDSVDVVVAAPGYLEQFRAAAPGTQQLVYSNVSNLYLSLLTDWLNYADARGIDRELAFYHVAAATAFTGNSPSSQPVNWFWNVARSSAGAWEDLTKPARTNDAGDTPFGAAAGDTLALGYTERFRELSVNLTTAAGAGWSGVIEYATATDAQGRPTAWKTLTLLADGTAGFTRSGVVTFDPPADWVPSSVNGSAGLYHLRVRTLSAGAAPVAGLILGRDYVGANGTSKGVIPAFDRLADANGDGYLTDAEYAARRAGFDARFRYESRLTQPNYGQMRFAVNPSSDAIRAWAADYELRFLAKYPLADGLFLDNSNGRSPARGIAVEESDAAFAADLARLIDAVEEAIAPRWVLANTAGQYRESDTAVSLTNASMEEFAIRAVSHNPVQFEDLSKTVKNRLAATPPGSLLVIDSMPTGGSPTDPRTQIATLAYYYLLADPERTALMFYGGFEPQSSWTRHWSPAAAFDVGRPANEWSVLATGTDPADPQRSYKVYRRDYENALVLYKPLSYKQGLGPGTAADATATTHQLNGVYRPLNADGTLGAAVTSVTLRGGEGAILVRA